MHMTFFKSNWYLKIEQHFRFPRVLMHWWKECHQRGGEMCPVWSKYNTSTFEAIEAGVWAQTVFRVLLHLGISSVSLSWAPHNSQPECVIPTSTQVSAKLLNCTSFQACFLDTTISLPFQPTQILSCQILKQCLRSWFDHQQHFLCYLINQHCFAYTMDYNHWDKISCELLFL